MSIYKTDFAGRELTIETGKTAFLANGACIVRYGDTVVQVTATMSPEPRDGIDFFPLSVDYEERLYSVGKIPGGFTKREGRASEKAILTSRVIDRPFRPLFPKDLRNDVSIVALVLSVEQDNSPEVAAMIGSAVAVSMSDIPFNGPIAGLHVGLVDGKIVLNPNEAEKAVSELELTLCASKEKIVMIEAGAKEVPEEKMLEAIKVGHKEIKKICDFINTIVAAEGKAKISYKSCIPGEDVYEAVKKIAYEPLKQALDNAAKEVRDEKTRAVEKEVKEALAEEFPERGHEVAEVLYKLQKHIVRDWIYEEGKRVDGRGLMDLRELSAEVGVLPRTHGSGMFARGYTQVLTVATLGAIADMQKLDGLDNEETKRYMHHYNFPSYSVGETRPSRGPGRREIGHGALAERALVPVLPSEEEFPYAIRTVSEILTSNGSTSQGSICASSLALMDAGVPLKAPVAGISIGLVTKGDKYKTMLDIQGIEDFFGDMDFKVAGTKKGITAIQVDIKVDGLSYEIIEEAFTKTRDSRYGILDGVMKNAIAEPRAELSKYAPRLISFNINPDKIRDVIGSGGKVIQKIVADTGVKIDITDDGKVVILAIDSEKGNEAKAIIESIIEEPEVGKVYNGKVVKIMNFGAFVEFLPGKDGLVHISKIADKRIEKVEDVLKEGDEVKVKVMGFENGKVNLSMKDA
ncbi:polyribonucleotide nucleotidyltransferase [Treponema sp. R6D11]